jgi:signal transduction histidine kinase
LEDRRDSGSGHPLSRQIGAQRPDRETREPKGDEDHRRECIEGAGRDRGAICGLVPAWIVGDAVHGQRLEAAARAEAAVRDARERASRLELTVANERRHIARELHDVVAHALSVMLLQTGAAPQVLDTSPVRARDALLLAEATGRDAMAELRRLLGVLAEEGEDAGIAPQAGLAQMPALLEWVRDAGLFVSLEVEGEERPLPVGIDVTAYRIAQEALTNALRYARAPTIVHLAHEPGHLRLEVLDEGPAVALEIEPAGV